MSSYMPRRVNFQLRSLLLLSLGHFTVDFYAGFVAPLVPILRQHIGFSLTEAAFLISVFSIFASFSQMGFGFLYDRLKNPYALALGPLLAGLTISCLGLASTFSTLVVIAIAGAISVAAFHPQGAALAAIKSGNRLSVGMSIFVTGGAAGFATGSLVSSVIVEAAGLSAITYAMFPAIGVASVIWCCLDKESDNVTRGSSQKDEVGLGSQLLFGLGGLAMIRASLILGYFAFLPLYLTAEGVSISMVGSTLFIFGLSSGLGGLTAGFWAEQLGEKNLLYFSYLAPFPLCSAYLLAGTSLEGLLCLGVAGYAMSSGIPVVISIGQRSFPKRRGAISSVLMGASWGAAALLITPAGIIAEQVGIYAVLWGFTLSSVFGFILANVLFQRRIVTPV